MGPDPAAHFRNAPETVKTYGYCMTIRFTLARAIGSVSTWGLKHVFRRPAANFPGKVGLYVDPLLIGHLRSRVREGSVVVAGTNGKTTVTNLLADTLEAAGKTVACNRTGANLDSGVATELLHTQRADWGVFESDELWLARIAPQLQPDYVVLLNLFRDQLDRVGEIDHIQASIAGALAASPSTTLVYNADDPLCQVIADNVANRRIPFGIAEDMELPQNTVSDAALCQQCESLLEYGWRQYGQLGDYRCPHCGFSRAKPSYAAHGVRLTEGNVAFSVRSKSGDARVEAPFPGAYMAYNLLATFVAADLCGAPASAFDDAVRAFAPNNGRLQPYEIDGARVLLNLAKNPTGFNQNLRIIMHEAGPKAVAFFINDKEADGHDVSWLWDIDFQELAASDNLVAFAGGIRRNDLQVRLKYAGIDAGLADGAGDFLAKARAKAPGARFYVIANYTALPGVKAELDQMTQLPEPEEEKPDSIRPGMQSENLAGEKLVIAHLYPELLNLYGDGGNVTVLAERARRRGIDVEIARVEHGQTADFSKVDIAFLGGGPDREQHLASRDLIEQAHALRDYVEDDGVLLAICGGYQILGREWLLGNEAVAGLDVAGLTTERAEGGSHNRLVGNIVLDSPLANMPVVGYENHAGRTYLDEGVEPFGRIHGRRGNGNNGTDGADGMRYRNAIGTYLHGPLLAKNPEVADWLIERALARRAAKQGRPAPALPPLDDTAERAANEFMRCR